MHMVGPPLSAAINPYLYVLSASSFVKAPLSYFLLPRVPDGNTGFLAITAERMETGFDVDADRVNRRLNSAGLPFPRDTRVLWEPRGGRLNSAKSSLNRFVCRLLDQRDPVGFGDHVPTWLAQFLCLSFKLRLFLRQIRGKAAG
jgi:hypothetical protein